MTFDPLKSFHYPDLVVLKGELRGTPQLRIGMEPPYGTDTKKIIYYEFRGYGTPPDDVGSPGDIFWDVTFPYIFYVRGTDIWEAWNPGASAGGSGPTWFAQQSLKSKLKTDIKQFHSLGKNVQTKLATTLSSAPSFQLLSFEIPENRARHDAELQRRGQHEAEVGRFPPSTAPSPSKKKRPNSEEIAGDRSLPGQSTSLTFLPYRTPRE
ncbi:hypothetical protein DFH07DRAFT_951758 [Mycena maculata]|uniref:Uncharacterized protein n=1 Tax=Mycena maculata TaxID=230809 RepID=A0AAD7NVE0_9AGAR|nr:hypothetical protein DFH07DRAFT_951758 [Mycena maculata]